MEPDSLPFGELTCPNFNQLDRFGKGPHTPKMFEHLAISQGLGCGGVFGQATLDQLLGFRNQTEVEHGINPSLDASVQFGDGPADSEEKMV